MKKIASLIFMVLILSTNTNAQSLNDTNKNFNPKENLYTYKLDNGLQLVVKQDKKAPTVVHMVWYKVGSFDELPHKTGLSHILEHLMFKGTQKNSEFSKIMASLGAKENAFTSANYTVYHQQLPSENLGKAIELEADRMENLNFSSKEFNDKFNKEIKVIQEERRLRTDDQPDSKLYEQLLASSYLVNNTRTPTIGWMEDIQSTSYQDAKNWYKKYYHPNNATVVIVGDVEPQNVYNLVKKNYGNYKSVPIERYTRDEPQQQGRKYLELYSNQIEEPSIYMLYKAINYKDNPKSALSIALLTTLLSGYEYAYLDKNLVKQQKLASSISVSYSPLQRSNSHIMIYAKPTNGNNIQDLSEKIHQDILNLSNTITNEDLNRAKKQWTAYNIYKKDSLFNTAMELGTAYSTGYDFNIIQQMEKGIQEVSLEDIKQVIKLYINKKQQSIGALLPEESKL